MRLLAFDTSTDRMSIAVARPDAAGVVQVWAHEAAGGAAASAALLPSIGQLMASAGLAYADLDAIVFGRGPGAFTGLRGACAVAQALALGARAAIDGRPLPLLGLDSLLIVAEQARQQHANARSPWQVLAMLDARMDEIYAASYRWDGRDWHTLSGPALAKAEALATRGHDALAGNVFTAYGERLGLDAPMLPRLDALPGAGAMLRLAPALLATGHAVDPALALPMYVRDKVASTSSERAAAKAAAATAT